MGAWWWNKAEFVLTSSLLMVNSKPNLSYIIQWVFGGVFLLLSTMLAVPFYFIFTQSSPGTKSGSGLFLSFFFSSEMFHLESSLTQSDSYGAHWWSNSSWLLKPCSHSLIQSTHLCACFYFILFYFPGPKAASMIYNPDGSQTERGYVLNAELPGSPAGTYWVCCLSLLVKFIATPSLILLTKALGLRFPAYLSNRRTCEGSSSR